MRARVSLMVGGLVLATAVQLAVVGRAQTSAAPANDVLPPANAMPAALARDVDRVIEALWTGFDERAAIEHVEVVGPTWRLAGNASFDRAIDRVHARLRSADFRAADLRVDEYAGGGRGWEHAVGTLALVRDGQPDEIVLSRETHRVALAINSFSTPAGGVVAPVVDVGRGETDADYAGKMLKGAVVLGDGPLQRLWQRAVVGGGAIGVVSTQIASYITPDSPGAVSTPRDQWDILQWGSVPYDEARRGFGFKASPRAAATLRRAIAAGRAPGARVRVTVESTFSGKPARMLIAEIPGSAAPGERVVMAAHVQEPGANDNASGLATLVELARALKTGVSSGRIPRPLRTLTFLWIDEIAGSRQWLQAHPAEAAGVKHMFSLDMTGENVAKTGGRFLVERWPDPGAVWPRPWDPHSEWGASEVKAETLKGDLLNDLHLAICQRVARKSGWVVGTNPYEGGSDHTVFGGAGVPSLLDWHFTDRYYHSSFDTPDKSSAAEMKNVGVAVAASAWVLASGTAERARDVATLVEVAGQSRIELEAREGQLLARASSDPAAAAAREQTILGAWRKWYTEAVASASRLVVGPGAPPAQPDVTLAQLWLAVDRALMPYQGPELPDPALWATETAGARAVLERALGSANARVRAVAVRSLGRFERATDVPRLATFLDDADEDVRVEAAMAIGQAMHRRQNTPASIESATTLLLGRLPSASGRIRVAFLESLGRVRNDRAATQKIEEAVWGSGSVSDFLVWLPPVLVRDTGYSVSARPRAALMALAAPTATSQTPNVVAIRGVGPTLTEADALFIGRAATYRCPSASDRQCGWEIRHAGVDLVNPAWAATAPLLEAARHDPAFQIRLVALRKIAARIAASGVCGPLVDAFADAVPIVALEAMRLVDPRCADRAAIAARLETVARGLSASASRASWHAPARALESLGRLDAARAAALLPMAAGHAAWEVRATAGRVAGALKDAAVLEQLASDAHANVVTEAIDELARLRSPAAVPAALRALGQRDYQLVRAAALALRGVENAARATARLVAALNRLTAEARDTSRDPRIAILDRLKEFASPPAGGPSPVAAHRADLERHLSDFDPAVANAAADVLAAITATRPVPRPAWRDPQQPTEAFLAALPERMRITMVDGDVLDLRLLKDDAPLTVARFVARARAGAYDGLTLHRNVPLFVVQGGSPGANEYVGDARYMRDEIGLGRHQRGAVGISTRGRNTGDAQIFIDLVDIPRLNFDYTVFAIVEPPAAGAAAGVRTGMAAVDAMLEGAVIRSIR